MRNLCQRLKTKVMTDKKMQEVERLIKKGSKFIGIYGMGSPAYFTDLKGPTPIEAIKHFHSCYNAILYLVYDVENSIMYDSRENDENDERGCLNRTFFAKNHYKL